MHKVGLDMNPEELINDYMGIFNHKIKELTDVQQEACREIRRKGRNKIAALISRQNRRRTVALLQASLNGFNDEP